MAIMENRMETTTWGLRFKGLGFRVVESYNGDPFLRTLNFGVHITVGTQKGIIILPTICKCPLGVSRGYTRPYRRITGATRSKRSGIEIYGLGYPPSRVFHWQHFASGIRIGNCNSKSQC